MPYNRIRRLNTVNIKSPAIGHYTEPVASNSCIYNQFPYGQFLLVSKYFLIFQVTTFQWIFHQNSPHKHFVLPHFKAYTSTLA